MTVHQLRHRPVESVQGALALDLAPRRRPPRVVRPSPRRRRGLADVIPIDPGARSAVDAWVLRYVQAAVEVTGGDRPVTQLLRWSTAEVYADLHRRATVVGRAGAHEPGQGRVQPVRPQVASVHTSFVASGAVEASARVRYGAHSRALALRFEQRLAKKDDQPRWLCVAIEFA